MTQPFEPPAAVYPLPRPADDARFTFGLVSDIGEVLAEHGYPPIRNGADHMRFQQALFGAIYDTNTEVTP